MRKIFTLMLALFAMVAVQAQSLLNEDFENGIPSTWVNIDADNDGNSWLSSAGVTGVTGHNGSDGCAYSCSYYDGTVLTPNNWLITPAITLTGPATLTFWVAAQDASYAAEHYGVYISTTAGTTPADFTLLYEETLDANGGARVQGTWKQKTVNLANYTGTVRIAFRHFNCTDMFYMNIDDVVIFAQPTSPTIDPNTTTIDFGNVVLGNPSVNTVTVDAYNLTSSISATTAAPFEVSADGNSFATTATIPSTGGTLHVRYNPTTTGANNGSVTLASTGASNVTINLTGIGIECNGVTPPFSEGFESSIDCWTMISMDPANDDKFGIYADPAAYAGSQDFRFSSYNSATDYNQWLISPELNLGSTSTYMVNFYYAGYTSSDNFKVLYSTTNNTPSSFTELADFTSVATDWTLAALPLPAGTKYVAIDYYGNYAYYLYVDNFSISALSAPDVTISGPVQVAVGTSGTFTASSPLADSFAWTVDGVAAASTTDVLTHTFNTPGNHVVKVTATNSIGSASDSMDVNVYTCDAITTFPFTETFTETSSSVGCWQIVDNNNDGNTFVINTTAGQVVYSYSSTENADEYLISPEMVIGNNLYGHVDYACASASYPEKFSIYVIPQNGSIANAVNIVPTVDVTNTSFETQNFDLSTYANQTIRVAIKAESDADKYLLGFANFVVEEMPAPSITANPTSLSFSTVVGTPSTAKTAAITAYSLTSDISVSTTAPFQVSANGASYGTTATIPATGVYNGVVYVRYNPTAAGTQTGTVTLTSGSLSATINVSGTALDCSQPQTLPFTENFDNGMPVCWSVLDVDGDGYTWEPSTEPYSYYSGVDLSGTGYNDSYGFILSGSFSNALGSALTPDNWLITPALSIPSSGATLSFYVAAQDASYANEHYGVYVSTSGTNPSNFTLLYEEDLDADGGPRATGTWKQKMVNLPYGGQNIYLAIRHFNCEDMFLIDIDDFSVTPGVGIENHGLSTKIYPNPANTVLNINATSNINRVEVYNMMGQMVGMYEANDVNTQINTSSFANGVYTVKISTENGTSTKKFTVAR